MTTTEATAQPIIFDTQSIRAILSGCKTVTRRILNPQPEIDTNGRWALWNHFVRKIPDDAYCYELRSPPIHTFCPYGVIGDRLWVREPWCGTFNSDGDISGVCCYRADTNKEHTYSFDVRSTEIWDVVGHTGWRSPMSMFRWASRLTLEVTNLYIEQLNIDTMTEAEFQLEGVESYMSDQSMSYAAAFAQRWNQSHRKKGTTTAKPYVWRIEFKQVVPE